MKALTRAIQLPAGFDEKSNSFFFAKKFLRSPSYALTFLLCKKACLFHLGPRAQLNCPGKFTIF